MTRDERLARLEATCRSQRDVINDLLDQLAEANLKIRFAFSLMRVAKHTGKILLGADGKPTLDLIDGYTAYMNGGREQMITVIEREILAMQEALARAEAEAATGDAGTPGAESGEGDRRSDPVEDHPASADATEARS